MCEDCGCSLPEEAPAQSGPRRYQSASDAARVLGGDSRTIAAPEKAPVLREKKTIQVLRQILDRNNTDADAIRADLAAHRQLAVNIMGSPGAGKTTFLENLATRLRENNLDLAVLEGDLATDQDSRRLLSAGIAARQITTGTACHLDAWLVKKHLSHFTGPEYPIVFIENIGNLVCPAAYDVGAHLNITLLSAPEGDDKITKYPVIFQKTDVLILSKMDTAHFFGFSSKRARADFAKLNPKGVVLELDLGGKNPPSPDLAAMTEIIITKREELYAHVSGRAG